ncbi:MAG: ABC transporter ATP-binding protein [Methanosarcinaceae archaeon]|nr:ABC transporter ATP-binding protein [Methanosarcinaceae archaeon]MDD4497358.1 ABC transporter ATP-binding protein [Methanosarcinaceae archaeon]
MTSEKILSPDRPVSPESSSAGFPLLAVRGLKVHFPGSEGPVTPLDRVDLEIREGECFGVIGESGSGKTLLCLSILRLLPPEARTEGKVLFRGRDLFSLPASELQSLRGREIGAVFQNPSTSLDPVFSAGYQLKEALRAGSDLSGGQEESLKARALRILRKVSFRDPKMRFGQYPHQLSGGQKQRVMIGMGIAAVPSFIIADEPTKGLDTRTRQNITALLQETCRESTMLLITHDLDLAGILCDTLAVMYAGEIVEIAKKRDFFDSPFHPFSQGLLSSLPAGGLQVIPGAAPSLLSLPQGCRFSERCLHSSKLCRKKHPDLFPAAGGRKVRCFLYA